MLKEADLIDCVLASLQAHIRHVVSLDELLDSISEEQINQEEIAKFKAQIADNEVKLEEARQFKATLYENFINNLISKKDYQDLKNLYTGRAEQAQEAIDRLRAEMELVTNNNSSRLRWTQHFKEFSAMTILLIHSLTRLGRDVDKVTKYWHLLRDLGVSVHTADCGEVDLSLDTMLRRMIEEMRKRPR